MRATPPSVANVLATVHALMKERADREDVIAKCEARIQEIDALLESVSEQLGTPPTLATRPQESSAGKPVLDGRSVGTLTAHLLDVLFNASRGLTRIELKAEVSKHPKFGEMIRKSPNAFYNNTIRLIRNDKIIERDGYLFHPDRAPLPEGEDDPSGQHLPANVTSLFGPVAGASDA